MLFYFTPENIKTNSAIFENINKSISVRLVSYRHRIQSNLMENLSANWADVLRNHTPQ